MILTIVNVVYVLVAVAMIALVLLQRGSGAAAGSGFGAGASATVFGSRGASNFLSKSTAILAIIFFGMSLGMAMYASRGNRAAEPERDLGVMGQLQQAPPEDAAVPVLAPQPAGDVPAAPAPAATPAAPEAGSQDVPPAAPAGEGDQG